MAAITPIDIVASISGSLDKNENVHFRTRAGKTHAYIVRNPYTGEPTPQQTANRRSFGERSKLTSQILADPIQRQQWQHDYNLYRRRRHSRPRYTTLRGFILANI